MKNSYNIFIVILGLLIWSAPIAATAQFAVFQVTGSVGTGGAAGLRAANVFGVDQSTWATPSSYYTPGVGNPAVSTSDYYHLTGLYQFRPYDLLDSSCGTVGASIAASSGRYLWVVSPDHPGTYSWFDGQDFRYGFSNDPGVFPSRLETAFLGGFLSASYGNNIAAASVATVTAGISNGSGSSGTILNVTALSGTVSQGALVTGAGVTAGTSINNTPGTGTGGIGTYNLDRASNVAPGTSLTISQANFELYQAPWFYCDPDDASFPFKISAEGQADSIQHEQGFAKSANLTSWTMAGPTHVNPTFTQWSSFQRLVRTGANAWTSSGLKAYFTPNVFANGTWASTDGGLSFAPVSNFNSCLPVNPPNYALGANDANTCFSASTREFFFTASPNFTTSGQLSTYARESQGNGVANGGSQIDRLPIDSSYNVLASPTRTTIANYTGIFPGPTYLQAVNAYVEDGVAHIYAQIGFPPSSNSQGAADAQPYSAPAFVVGQMASGVLTVSSVVSGTVPIPGGIASNEQITSQLTGTPGGVGTYQCTGSSCFDTSAGTTFQINGGGLWQQAIDYYTEVVDATAAAQAAPVGVRATAASGVVTLAWYDALPNRTYRVYRGNVSAQTTLIGDFNAITATDATAPLNQVNYYKVVTLQSGVERRSRVVSTFVSSSTTFVNAHITRALAAGADFGTIDRAWLDQIDAWLTANSLKSSLMFWTDAAFGVIKNVSGTISRVMDLGTTWLPRGGDYTPCGASPCNTGGTGSSTTYDPLGIGQVPAWVNTASTSHGYYGGAGTIAIPGRVNNFRRKKQVTVMAAYKRPSGAADTTFLASDEFGGMSLQHLAGTPGTASFSLSDATHAVTDTLAVGGSATAFHVIAGTYDQSLVKVYVDGAAGSGASGYVPTTVLSSSGTANDFLTGQTNFGPNQTKFLGTGSKNSKYIYNTGYVFTSNEAQTSVMDLIVFEKALTPTQVADLTTILTQRQSPTPAISYSVTADFGATCDGSVNDAPFFASGLTTALAYQAMHPGALIEYTIPASKTCVFKSGGSGTAFAAGLKNFTMNGNGSTINDNSGSGNGFFLGGATGLIQDNTHSARIATVSAGVSYVTFTTAAQTSLVSVGDWGLVAGGDYQGGGAFPINPWVWDYVQVLSKDGACHGTGTVCFTTPLSNGYKSTWPHYFDGSAFEIDSGGPGTYYALNQDWDTRQVYRNLTISQVGQTYSVGRDITFETVTFTGAACGVPTQNMSYRVIKGTMTNCVVEIDKVNDYVAYVSTTVKQLDFQSASVKTFAFDGSTATTGIAGTGIANYITGSTVASMSFGASNYGPSSGPTLAQNSVLSAVATGGASEHYMNSRGSWSGGVLTVPHNFTVTSAANNGSGLIRVTVDSTAGYSTGYATQLSSSVSSCHRADTTNPWFVTVIDGTHFDLQGSTFVATCTGVGGSLPLAWAKPGGNYYWASRDLTQGPGFQITDLTQDATNTYVTTSLSGGLPTMALNVTPPDDVTIKTHPAPQFTCTNCTGSDFAVALSLAPPGTPIWSYYLNTYTSATTPFLVPIWGQMVSIKETVNVANGSALTFGLDTPFIDFLNSVTRSSYNTTINTQLTGERDIFPTTNSGGQSGDTITAPGTGAWLINNQITPKFSGAAGAASVTIEIKTDHGVVNP